MSGLTLAERVVALHQALADIPHAFGGALALAYYAEPRATVDIDVNVFVPAERFDDVAGPLRELGVTVDDQAAELVARDGQARVWWDATPVDLFFAYDPFHDAAARARRVVPFADQEIPVLAPEHLMVCKAVFNRGKDWIDIDAMRALHQPIDGVEVLRWVGRIVGDEDPRYERLVTLLTT
ncbi:MAG: nucleotidyl transferase AbiEii/AbiGii toxin family protein [Acidimicrobiia bacterium]